MSDAVWWVWLPLIALVLESLAIALSAHKPRKTRDRVTAILDALGHLSYAIVVIYLGKKANLI